MSESVDLVSLNQHGATHNERASVYISDNMDADERELAAEMASYFQQQDKPAAKTAVLIPVAAHQDGELIIPTLAEYARQRTSQPFTVFLHLNAPVDTTAADKVKSAELNIAKARELFPHLDVRSCTALYNNPTIGRIRRDLWNAAFMLAYHEHGFSSDVIGFNNDIDTHRISPHYIDRVQQYYERRNKKVNKLLGETVVARSVQKPVATRVSHAVIPSHPNTGKVTTWIDNSFFQAPNHAGYEAGLVIPFSTYAYKIGFDEESQTYETHWVGTNENTPYISGAQLSTSPRRYIDRLHHHDSSEIWTNDTFGADDGCRDNLRDDISTERAEDVIAERLEDDIMHFWLPGAMLPIYKDMENKIMLGLDDESYLAETIQWGATTAERQLAKAERLLRLVVGSPILADLVKESFDAESYAHRQIKSMFYLYKAYNGYDVDATAATE